MPELEGPTAHERKMEALAKRLKKEAKAALRELRKKYGLKAIYHTYEEPTWAGPPSKYYRYCDYESEWFFLLTSEKKVTKPQRKKIALLESIIHWERNMGEPLSDELIASHGQGWLVEEGLVKPVEMIDDEELAEKARIEELALPALQAVQRVIRLIPEADKKAVRDSLKSKI